MSGVVQGITNGFTALGNWLLAIVTGIWTAILSVLDVGLALIVQVVGWLLVGLVSVLGFVLQLLINFVPDSPTPDESAYSGFSSLAMANQYVPVAEAFALLPVFGTIAAGIGIWKLVKFIRGGG